MKTLRIILALPFVAVAVLSMLLARAIGGKQ